MTLAQHETTLHRGVGHETERLFVTLSTKVINLVYLKMRRGYQVWGKAGGLVVSSSCAHDRQLPSSARCLDLADRVCHRSHNKLAAVD